MAQGLAYLRLAESATALKDITLLAGLISTGVNPDLLNEYGETYLHQLAKLGWEDGIATVLAGNANPNVQDVTGLTPLHRAIIKNNHQAVRMLLAGGANPLLAFTSLHEGLIYAYQVGHAKCAEVLSEDPESIPRQTAVQKIATIKANYFPTVQL